MKKRNKTLLVFIGLMLVLLFPVRQIYKDGGTTTYTAILYKVIKWKTLDGKTDTNFYIFPFNFKSLDSYRKSNNGGIGVTQTDYLFNLRNKYIGDNSATSQLLEALEISKLGSYTIELETSTRPYVLYINFSNPISEENFTDDKYSVFKEKMKMYSIILLALIDNTDEIHYNDRYCDCIDNIVKVKVDDFKKEYGNIKDSSKSIETLHSLLINVGYYK